MNKEWDNTLISVPHVVNTALVFPISLLLVVFPIHLLARRLSWFSPAFQPPLPFFFSFNFVKLSLCFCFNFLVVVLLHLLFVKNFYSSVSL
jgi:hypothetical protein